MDVKLIVLKGVEKLLAFSRKYMFVLMDFLIIIGSMLMFGMVSSLTNGSIWSALLPVYGVELVCIFGGMLIFKANRSLWRYASMGDFLRLMSAYGAGYIVAMVIIIILNIKGNSHFLLLVVVTFSLLCSLFIRMFGRVFAAYLRGRTQTAAIGKELIILGAGSAGLTLLNELRRNSMNPYRVSGFFDDDAGKVGKRVREVPVLDVIDRLPEYINTYPNCDVVLAIPSLSLLRRQQIIRMCAGLPCKLRIMLDALLMMVDGGNFVAGIREVKIEDLLGRTTVSFSKDELDDLIKDKCVLVTGGGGSIGSELCRQIVAANVDLLVIFDINENDAYMLYRELQHVYHNKLKIKVEIGSIVEAKRVNEVFEKYQPDVVFHGAAHKHVPVMEDSPYECISNNIFGTYNVLRATKEYKVKKFVQISTDKAVNPTNVMGATKRYCERMVNAFAKGSKTIFVSVRFGNVLGSHGSVIPIFQMQLEHGGPITITDKRITRYFMTIPEAAGLVIKAATIAENGKTYILDMAESVKIIDLAESFISLSGFKPYEEIDIVETGMRSGEKLYEELLIDPNNYQKTTQGKIYVEQEELEVTLKVLERELVILESCLNKRGDIVKALKVLVPTFKTPQEVNDRYHQDAEI